MATKKHTTATLPLFNTIDEHARPARACCECGKVLTGHNKAIRCGSCAARARYVAKHGHPPIRIIAACGTCGKEFEDYATNRTKSKHGVRFCSYACRAAWVGVHNSISRGCDGVSRSKSEKDALDYRKHADARRAAVNARYERDRERILADLRAKSRQLKQELVNAYGGVCVCCGETRIEFLTVDHIYGDGAEHRKRTGKGRGIYKDLKRQGFPQDNYRLLCFNCNLSMGLYGYCPHNPETMRQNFDKRPHKPGRRRTVA